MYTFGGKANTSIQVSWVQVQSFSTLSIQITKQDYTKSKEPHTKDYILYDSINVKFLEMAKL